jgi:hypothetical protein
MNNDCLPVYWCLNSCQGGIEMMNTQQSKDFTEELLGTWDSGIFEREDVEQVVDELRRLHSVNAELLQALEWIANRCPAQFLLQDVHKIHQESAFDAGICARDAIARAVGLNKAQE